MKTDRELQQDVLAELDWDPSVNATRIGVEVKEGVVTLSGHVESYGQKWNAQRVPFRVSGVQGVAIELDVALPDGSKRLDADIAAAALSALNWNASVPKDSVKVMVENGWITLAGTVGWAYARRAAEDCVRELLGIHGVINTIEIGPQAKPTDIKTKIEAALQRRAHFDATAIGVRVDQGRVTLTGAVDSWAEREIVEMAAWNAPGVHSVVDQMVVAP